RGRAAMGVLFVTVSDVSLEKQIHIVTTLRSILTRARGSLVVLHASPEVKAAVDVWGSVGNSLPLMQRVKHQFDPERILSPGRFVGGI
ncbi:MAG: FAD-binding oxidoreductase, partial [Chloroflexota bacterium]|nr:FAD-binding oxidoreductase [Chloroflexota bacterium]